MVGAISLFPLYMKTISAKIPEFSFLVKSVFLVRNASLINRFILLRWAAVLIFFVTVYPTCRDVFLESDNRTKAFMGCFSNLLPRAITLVNVPNPLRISIDGSFESMWPLFSGTCFLFFVAHWQLFSTCGTPPVYNFSPVFCCHSSSKPVRVFSFTFVRLICSFHTIKLSLSSFVTLFTLLPKINLLKYWCTNKETWTENYF